MLNDEDGKLIKYLFLVTSIDEELIYKEYIKPFGINPKEVHLTRLFMDPKKKKTSATMMKQYLSETLDPLIKIVNPKYLVICNPDYFKIMTKSKKADVKLGYILEYKAKKAIYIPSYKQVFYDREKIRSKIKIGISALLKYDKGEYEEPGTNIITRCCYPRSVDSIQKALQDLIKRNVPLTCDIEAFSLKHYNAGLGSITFCWNEHEGISFKIDPSREVRNEPVRKLLKDFLIKFNNTLIFHNIAYDASVLIYQLFMKDIGDTKGLLEGLKILLSNWEDTKLIAYLATNTCAGNELGLKVLAQQFAGDYAQEDINDITKIPEEQLLEYNLVDGLSTWYVYNKYYPKMVADNQLEIYTKLFKPSTIDIIQMQLTGMPLNMDRVHEVNQLLENDKKSALDNILNNSIISEFQLKLNEDWVRRKNAKLKKLKKTLADAHEVFNPNSPTHLQKLLYGFLGLPVLDRTKTNQPSTDSETIEALINHTDSPEVKTILQGLVDFKAVDKILTTFMPVFLNAIPSKDGRSYIFGNFNLGGTVSGRLSSSNPNLNYRAL